MLMEMYICVQGRYELGYNNTKKVACVPSKDSDQLGICPDILET